jgi:hypothetical protein
MNLIKDKIMKDGPYDLIIGFSQGTANTRNFYKLATIIDPEYFEDIKDKMPLFFIQICATWPQFTYIWKG